MFFGKLLYFKLIYVFLKFFLYLKKLQRKLYLTITMETLFLKILLHNIEKYIFENVVYNKKNTFMLKKPTSKYHFLIIYLNM